MESHPISARNLLHLESLRFKSRRPQFRGSEISFAAMATWWQMLREEINGTIDDFKETSLSTRGSKRAKKSAFTWLE